MNMPRKLPCAMSWLATVALMATIVPLSADAFDPQPEPPLLRLQSQKIRIAGKLVKCQADAQAKALARGFDPQPEPPLPGLATCNEKAVIAMSKQESKCSQLLPAMCPQTAGAFIASVEAVTTALGQFAVQEIVPSERFTDLGDGTVLDTQTRLQWEKKTNLDGIANYADPHDADNDYNWNDAEEWLTGYTFPPIGTAFEDFLVKLNNGVASDGQAISGCFAGHCDWRLPTIVELQTILLAPYPCQTSPCIDTRFGPTKAEDYFSSTADAVTVFDAWSVAFDSAAKGTTGKDLFKYVRAVRSGQ